VLFWQKKEEKKSKTKEPMVFEENKYREQKEKELLEKRRKQSMGEGGLLE